jgi:hypothetical protein
MARSEVITCHEDWEGFFKREEGFKTPSVDNLASK